MMKGTNQSRIIQTKKRNESKEEQVGKEGRRKGNEYKKKEGRRMRKKEDGK